MAALKALAATAAAMLLPLPAAAQGVDAWQAFIVEASARFGLPQRWIKTVMRIESGGRTTLGGRPITSNRGAIGLMQLMPSTWAAMRQHLGLGFDPYDPHDNILAGTYYLRLMYDRFGYPGCFAAYNAGPGRYGSYLYEGRRLPAETIGYLAAAGPPLGPAAGPADRMSQPILFVRPAGEGGDAAAVTPPPTLFAIAPRP